MGDPQTDAVATSAPKKRSRKGIINATVLVEGVVELVSSVFSQLMNADKVTAAISKAKKQPAVKAMLAAAKAKDGPKGPAACRSAYNVFLQDFLGHMKTAGQEVSLMQAAAIWSILPSDVKTGLKERYEAIMKVYNDQLAAGVAVSMTQVIEEYMQNNNLEPVDHEQLWEQYKEAAAQATVDKAAAMAAAAAAGGSEAGNRQPSKAPKKPAAAAATAAAPGPSKPVSGKRSVQDQQQQPQTADNQQQSKKQKKEKHEKEKKHKSKKKDKKDKQSKKEKKKRSRSESGQTAGVEAPPSPSY